MSDVVYADSSIPIDVLPQEFRRHVDPASPGPARLMAARGLVPMGTPGTLLTAIFMLTSDGDRQVSSTAASTLDDLPLDVLRPALAERLDVRVLDSLAERFLRSPELLDLIIMNAATADETIRFITTKAKERQLELIASNQVRLLRHTKIIEALYLNPQTRMSTVDRVIDFAVRAGVYLPGIPAFKEAAEALGLEVPTEGQAAPVIPEGLELVAEPAAAPVEAEAAADDSEFSSFLQESVARDADGEDLSDLEAAFGQGEGLEGYESAEPEKAEEEKKLGRSAQIAAMTMSQKVRLGLLGSKTDRGILIRDRNRMVCMAVIKSPKVQKQEIAAYAAMRNISDDVIRYIATKRQWLKNYQIKIALVKNPKCPPSTALKLLPHLRKADLKGLVSDKGIPGVISTTAKGMLRGREG